MQLNKILQSQFNILVGKQMSLSGFTQGIRTVFGSLGKIFGPIWVSASMDRYILMNSLIFGIQFVVLVKKLMQIILSAS